MDELFLEYNKRQENMIRFLQISDIHFTDEMGSSDEYAQMKCKFIEDVAECHRVMGEIDHVLICGDIAFSGQDTQYKEARQFISKICDQAGCSEEDVFVVPGNHDKKRDVYVRARGIMRGALLAGNNTKQLIDSKVKEPMAIGILYAPFKQYYKMAAEYLCISDVARKAAAFPESDQETGGVPKFEPGDDMYWSESLGVLNGFNVALYGSNTSLLSDKDDGESHSIDESKQHLQVLPLQAYNATAGSNDIHILMLHHPMTEIINGEKVGKIIDGQFKVQLYGHMHRQSSSSDGAIKIYSGALQPPESGDDYFPVYNLIEMDVVEDSGNPCLKVSVYSRKWNSREFVEYADETKTGDRALKLSLPHNDAWEKTMDRIRKGEPAMSKEESEAIVSPHVVKHAFLKSEKAQRIISEMYSDKFDKITPNRIKYVTFLKQVEVDNKFGELNELLNKYGK